MGQHTKVSVVIPFVDAFDKLRPCIKHVIKNAGSKSIELILLDNGSATKFDYSEFKGKVRIVYIRNEQNIGVLQTYKQVFQYCQGGIIMFIHSDVLIHGKSWVSRIYKAFKYDDKLGLLGLFGARGIGVDGGRAGSMSNMLGKTWGKCDCHLVAAWHHGERISGVHPAVVLDGLAMIFRQETLYNLIENTDAFDSWRAIHHAYDKILSLKTLKLGQHVAVIDVEFDHWSGATANHSTTYDNVAREWAKKHGYWSNTENGDQMVYRAAHEQMFNEFSSNFPINVFGHYNYEWNGR